MINKQKDVLHGGEVGLPPSRPDSRRSPTLAQVGGILAGIGLTVALFVAGEAFVDPALQDAAKMGALASALMGPAGLGVAGGWECGDGE